MLVRSFLHWMKTAPAQDRADATFALAEAFLHSPLSPEDRSETIAALTLALDDPSPLVRQALAAVFAHAETAPRPIVVSLANDRDDIAAPVLAFSPLLTDAELVDRAALGEGVIQSAIALRPHVSDALAAALVEIGERDAVAALLANPGADIAAFSLRRIAERFGADAEIRQTLLARDDLPIDARHGLLVAVTGELTRFVTGCGWLPPARAERLAVEARDAGTVILAGDSDPDTVGDLVAHLRHSGQLTAALLLRSVLSGDTRVLEAALASLAEMPLRRVSGLVHNRFLPGFKALYRRAGLPDALAPAFEAALAAINELDGEAGREGRLSRTIVERVLTSCAALGTAEVDALMALLARFQAEAAREEARTIAEVWLAEAPRLIAIRHPLLDAAEFDARLEAALAAELDLAA